MDKRFLAILTTLVVIFVGIFIFAQGSNDNNGGSSGAQASNHTFGEGAKNVTLTEYGDFQCSACEGFEPVITQVRETYKADIKFQFRHLPLVSIHPNAFAASRAAEAASLQNKFWEMHDALYAPANWQSWINTNTPVDKFNAYANQIGLNVDKFKTDYVSTAVNDTINADLAEFSKTGRQMSTPTFFLNNVYVENSKLTDQNNRPQFEKFKELIDAEIAKQTQQ